MPKPARAIWRGAISFGLVHIPVTLLPATRESGIDFDWLDKRSMDPVGYKRVNKRTGKEVTRENIVRGVARPNGDYVVLSDKEIAAAYPRSTRTIDIEAFVPLADIPLIYYDRPYYVAPASKGEKVYALLREALRDSGRAGLSRIVIQTKQHLAVLVPWDNALLLNLLRWSADIRRYEGPPLPKAGARAAGLNPRELKMAEQLVAGLSEPFKPQQFTDRFRAKVNTLVARKAKAGKTHAVEPAEQPPEESGGAQIIDLTELLKKSLRGGKPRAAKTGRSRAA